MFYNTIKLTGADLQTAKQNCKSQEGFIEWLFENVPALEITPSQLLALFGDNTPLTSIRRALTNLTNKNVLEKTGITTTGIYGKPEHIWKQAKKTVTNKFW